MTKLFKHSNQHHNNIKIKTKKMDDKEMSTL